MSESRCSQRSMRRRPYQRTIEAGTSLPIA
jgi:hypothetical protein